MTTPNNLPEIEQIYNNTNDLNQNIIKTLNGLIFNQSDSIVIDNVNKIKNVFTDEIANANKINSYYSTMKFGKTDSLNKLKEIYSETQDELEKNNKQYTEDILTNNRKTYYEREALYSLQNWNVFFWYLYYIAVVIFTLGIIFTPSSIPKYISILLVFLFVFYPYIIEPIINKVKEYFNVFYRVYPKNVYNNL
jgi:hypothetical protein